MTDPKTIPLQPDNAEQLIEGGPDSLQPIGNVTIVPPKDNPDETVELTPDMEDVDGVEISKDVEKEFNNT